MVWRGVVWMGMLEVVEGVVGETKVEVGGGWYGHVRSGRVW